MSLNTDNNIFKIIGKDYYDESSLLSLDTKQLKEEDIKELKYVYEDNGKSDLIIDKINPVMYMDKEIVGFELIDRYAYGRNNRTSKKIVLTLFYRY